MKTYLIIIIFFCIHLGLPSCEHEAIVNEIVVEHECIAEPAPIYHPGKMFNGHVAGLKNCLPFTASATVFIGSDSLNQIGLLVETFEDFGDHYNDKEVIMIGSKAYGKGIWPLIKDSIPNHQFQSYWTLQDHDVFEDVFRIDANYVKNRIIVTMIDSTNRIVQGSFDARFLLHSSVPSGKNPDTVIFTDCNFIAREP